MGLLSGTVRATSRAATPLGESLDNVSWCATSNQSHPPSPLATRVLGVCVVLDVLSDVSAVGTCRHPARPHCTRTSRLGRCAPNHLFCYSRRFPHLQNTECKKQNLTSVIEQHQHYYSSRQQQQLTSVLYTSLQQQSSKIQRKPRAGADGFGGAETTSPASPGSGLLGPPSLNILINQGHYRSDNSRKMRRDYTPNPYFIPYVS